MALYLGNSDKLKIVSDNVACRLKLIFESPITNINRLLSSDNFILQDSTGLYLLAKEDE